MRKENNEKKRIGITRRGFLKLAGTGAAVTSVAGSSIAEAAKTGTDDAGEAVRVNLIVNGRRRRVLVEPRWSLLYVLREKLGLTGTKIGCERGECGACTVLIDGQTRYACLTLAVEAEGKEIITVEGLLNGEKLGPVQQAFHEQDAFQCGFCTPGQIMAAEGLLRRNPDPSPEEIRRGMSGNLCRCGAYQHIFKAVRRAAALKKAGGEK
ncbi:MAG TPA: (2Fe-2S)-binding protein [Thermodesulfobacteriota bacterium]|nr:(2Fe-2S)-binding protein [Thermodesulfobacteriota bacterium]